MILVGYVPKPEGMAALRAAIAEAHLRGEALHVVNTSRGTQLVDPSWASEDDLKEVRELLDDSGVNYTLDHRVGGRGAGEEVVEAARALGATLVVIGLRRRSPTGKLLFGSNAQHILLDVACPVLAVKADRLS